MNLKCYEERPCFAKERGRCALLKMTYKDGACPFCKPDRDVTNGVYYPIEYNYAVKVVKK